MSQFHQVQELVGKLVQTSKKLIVPTELQSIIEQLSRIVLENQGSGPANFSFASMSTIDSHLINFSDSAEQLDSELIQMTQTALSVFEMMKIIAQFSFSAKKPTQSQVQGINQILNNKIQSILKCTQDHQYHAKSLQDGLNALIWVFSDQPKIIIDGAIESSEYNALKLKQKKEEKLTKWITHFINAIKALGNYVKENYPTGLAWNQKGEGDFPTLFADLRGSIPSTLQRTSASQPVQPAQQTVQTFIQAPLVQVQSQPAPQVVQVVQASQVPPPAPAVSQQPSYPPLTDTEKHLNDFKTASDKLDPEIKELTDLVLKAFDIMKYIMSYSSTLSKPTQEQLKEISTILQLVIFKPMNSLKVGNKFPNHLKTAIQGISVIGWVMTDMPKLAVDGAIESSEFYGNKILIMKQPDHSAWNNGFKGALRSLLPYVLTNFATGLSWKFKGSNDYSELYQVLKGEKIISNITQPAPSNPPPPPSNLPPPPPPMLLEMPVLDTVEVPQNEENNSRSALLSALNVGEDAIKAHLRHVTKEEKKKSHTSSNQSVPSVKPVIQAKDIASLPATLKEPRKYQKDNWFVVTLEENFKGEKIIFEENEIQQKQTLFVESCHNCTIMVKDKLKSVFVNKCNNTTIIVTRAVSGVELVDCHSSQVYILESVPSIQIDKSDTIRITFMKSKECDIVSSKTSGLNVTYALNDEGDMDKDTPVPEQFITKWDAQSSSFITSILSTFL